MARNCCKDTQVIASSNVIQPVPRVSRLSFELFPCLISPSPNRWSTTVSTELFLITNSMNRQAELLSSRTFLDADLHQYLHYTRSSLNQIALTTAKQYRHKHDAESGITTLSELRRLPINKCIYNWRRSLWPPPLCRANSLKLANPPISIQTLRTAQDPQQLLCSRHLPK